MQVTPDYVLNEMTYENLIMYSLATPVFRTAEDQKYINQKKKINPAMDANNPNNFKGLADGPIKTKE